MGLTSQLHGLKPTPEPSKDRDYSYTLAAVHALLTVWKALVISEEKVNTFEKDFLNEFKRDGIPENVFDNLVAYGVRSLLIYLHGPGQIITSKHVHYRDLSTLILERHYGHVAVQNQLLCVASVY